MGAQGADNFKLLEIQGALRAPFFLGGLRPLGPSAPRGWASPTLWPTATVVVKDLKTGAFGPSFQNYQRQTDRHTDTHTHRHWGFLI